MIKSDAILEKAIELKIQHKSFALVTVVRCESPTSAKPGAKAIVDVNGLIQGWIGGGCAQPAVIDTVKKSLKDGKARLIRVSPIKGGVIEDGIIDFGMNCHSGGTLDIFIDPIIPKPALLIIGISPSAQALSILAYRTGFDVSAMSVGADKSLYPDAIQIINKLDTSALNFGTPPFIVVATQGKRDEQSLEAAMLTDSNHIEFVASERKAKKVKQYLIERGHEKDKVDAIIAPAGIEIGAITPEEVALSILVGLVKARRREFVGDALVTKSTANTKSCCSNIDEKTNHKIAIDPVCGMEVEIATAEHQFRYQENTFYFCCATCKQNFEKSTEQYLKTGDTSV